MAFLRSRLDQAGVSTTQSIRDPDLKPHGSSARVAGLVLVRQRPSSASGVVFVTIEDETGTANLMIRPTVAGKFKKALAGAVIMVAGKVERVGEVVHVQAGQIWDISNQMRQLSGQSRDYR
jgi:error-prone DNA polymerase